MILEDEIDSYPRNKIQDALFPRHKVAIARNYEEAIKIYDAPYDLLLLDHDLGETGIHGKTGYDFTKWLVLQPPQPTAPDVLIHSHNQPGRVNMRKLLERFGFTTAEIPFGLRYIDILKKI